MADEIEAKSESEKKKEDWMNSKWRPMMGWMYMLVCTMDFVGFPVLWSLLQMISHGNVSSQWQPLTLQGAGLFHIAMGAVIGISAYGRTQEKLGGAAGPTMSFPQGAGTTYVPSTGNTNVNVSNQPSFGGSSSGGFGSTSSSATPSTPASGFGSSTGGFSAPATSGFGSGAGFGAPAAPTTTASGKKIVPDFGQPAI
jgi:Holin of 3TMs, for gene-transfer release